MTLSHVQETDAETWTFKVGGYHYDAPHAAKKRVADENDDVDYSDLRARVITTPVPSSDNYVSVVKVY